MLLQRYKGADILRVASVAGENIASSAGDALAAIHTAFGQSPAAGGWNIEGIVAIRDALSELANDPLLSGAFMISAPHTHWEPSRPVIVSYLDGRYTVGAQDVDKKGYYWPVSFLFSDDGPVPYEWADCSVRLQTEQLPYLYKVVEVVNGRFSIRQWPLGIALSFRFRDLLSNSYVSTIEWPLGGPEGRRLSAIERIDEFERRVGHQPFEQVYWHSFSDLPLSLTPDALALLEKLRTYAESGGGYENARKLLREAEKLIVN